MTPRKRRRATTSEASPARRAPRKPAANEALAPEHQRLVHELEVHQLELETQNHALREAQLVLEESRARYADLYDYGPVGHLTLDRAGVVRELNFAAAALLDQERRVVTGRPLRVFLSKECRERLDIHLRAALRAARAQTVELTVLGPGGRARDVELVSVAAPGRPDAGRDGAPILHSAMVDLSARAPGDERSKTERDARRHAEGLNRAKEEFLRLVSHELRSPLAPMLMWVRALRAGGASDSLRARAVDALETCIGVQGAMINDLVDVARGEAKSLRVERGPMDLLPVVSAVVDALAPSATVKEIELSMKVDPGPLQVWGDSTRLQQVVTHLLTSAILFSRAAGHVTVALHRRGDSVELRVESDDDEITAEQLSRVFEPFTSEALGARPPGLGMSLAVVRHLVECHGGRVTAERAGDGRGTSFFVILPRLDGDGSNDVG